MTNDFAGHPDASAGPVGGENPPPQEAAGPDPTAETAAAPAPDRSTEPAQPTPPDATGADGSEEIPEPELYDFSTSTQVPPAQHKTLEAIYGIYASALEPWLTARMRQEVAVTIELLEQRTFGRLRMELRKPCAVYTYAVEGSDAGAMIEIDPTACFAAVDRFLGGSGAVLEPDRELTPVEQRIVGTLARRMSVLLTDVWHEHVPIELTSSGYESIPEMLKIASADERYLVAGVRMTAEEWSGLVTVALPTGAVSGLLTSESVRGVSDVPITPATERARLQTSVLAARVPVAVRFPTFEIPFSAVMKLRAGAVLKTRIATDAPLEVLVAGQRRFLGTPGRTGDVLAVRITEATSEEGADPTTTFLRRASDRER